MVKRRGGAEHTGLGGNAPTADGCEICMESENG